MAKSAEAICREAAEAILTCEMMQSRDGCYISYSVPGGNECFTSMTYGTTREAQASRLERMRKELAAEFLRVHQEIERQAQT